MKSSFIWTLLFFFLGTQFLPAADLVINEFMADNDNVLQDEDGDYSDWIEIHNVSSNAINLNGWYLTDDIGDLAKWTFPATNIPAYGFLVLFASNKDRALAGSELHTNFKLTSNGEYLALVEPDGMTAAYEYNPTFPEQFSDWSYGLNTNLVERLYFTNASPGATNRGGTAGYAPVPDFSFDTGFYTNAISLTLSVTSGAAVIRYTLDCSEPDETSTAYTLPLNIQSRIGDSNYFSLFITATNRWGWLPDWNPPAGEVFKATVVRARTYEPGKAPSPIMTKTYFVDTNIWSRYPTLPVISIVSDEKHLFSDANGIYVPGDTGNNYGQGWERPAHITLIETNGALGFAQDFGIRIQGETSMQSPHKGLLVFARSEYGDADLDYRLFPNVRSSARDLTEFKRFMIRAWSSNRKFAFIPDTYTQNLLAGHDLDIQDYRPCMVFINGEYWGLQEIRESNKNPWYYHYHYGIDRDDPGFDILLGDRATVDEGDAVHWNNMINYINVNDMSLPVNYEYIQTQVDTENFILYIMHSAFSTKFDWPGQNEAKWRPRTPDGRWRWIQFDMDHSFGHPYNTDMLAQVLSNRPHPLLVDLLVNETFKHAFINCYADYMNTALRTDIMLGHFKAFTDTLRPYMPEFRDRWQLNYDWETQLNNMSNNIAGRVNFVRQNLVNKFALSGTVDLTLDISGSGDGKIVINDRITIDEETPGISASVYPWQGVYFQDVPVMLRAVPSKGSVFSRWSGAVSSPSNPVTILLSQAATVTAIFNESDPSLW